jgi:hypothetical protein
MATNLMHQIGECLQIARASPFDEVSATGLQDGAAAVTAVYP